jgi:hypothetical protein
VLRAETCDGIKLKVLFDENPIYYYRSFVVGGVVVVFAAARRLWSRIN